MTKEYEQLPTDEFKKFGTPIYMIAVSRDEGSYRKVLNFTYGDIDGMDDSEEWAYVWGSTPLYTNREYAKKAVKYLQALSDCEDIEIVEVPLELRKQLHEFAKKFKQRKL